MSDLTNFLRARFDEDHLAAKAAAVMRREDPRPNPLALNRWETRIDTAWAGEGRHDPAPVIAVHPTRALADVEAKRRILGVVVPAIDAGNATLQPILYALALPYRDHPDFRSSWLP